MNRYNGNGSKNSNYPIFVISILLSLLVCVGAIYFAFHYYNGIRTAETEASENMETFLKSESTEFPDEIQDDQDDPSKPYTPKTDVLEDSNTPAFGQQTELPDLLSSDDFVRKALIKLSPGLAQWLGSDQLIRRYILIINDFSQGARISKHMSFLRLDEPFTVEMSKNGMTFAPKSFHRYDTFTQAIQALDANATVQFYRQIRPLVLQIFAEFSYPQDMTFESIIKKAGAEILATPKIEGPIELIRPSAFYKFADLKLEALSPVQKQIIRMGPENAKIIQNKLREFLVALAQSDIP